MYQPLHWSNHCIAAEAGIPAAVEAMAGVHAAVEATAGVNVLVGAGIEPLVAVYAEAVAAVIASVVADIEPLAAVTASVAAVAVSVAASAEQQWVWMRMWTWEGEWLGWKEVAAEIAEPPHSKGETETTHHCTALQAHCARPHPVCACVCA